MSLAVMISRVASVVLLLNYGAGADTAPSTTFCENCRSEVATAAKGSVAAEPLHAAVDGLLGLSAQDAPSTTFCENCKTDMTLPRADVSKSLMLAEEAPSTTFCENCKTDVALPKADFSESLMLEEETPSTTFCENCKTDASLPKAAIAESLMLEEAPSTTFCENCRTDSSRGGDLPKADLSESLGLDEAPTTTFCENCRSAGDLSIFAKWDAVGRRVLRSRGARVACGASVLIMATAAIVGPLLARRAVHAADRTAEAQSEDHLLLEIA